MLNDSNNNIANFSDDYATTDSFKIKKKQQQGKYATMVEEMLK